MNKYLYTLSIAIFIGTISTEASNPAAAKDANPMNQQDKEIASYKLLVAKLKAEAETPEGKKRRAEYLAKRKEENRIKHEQFMVIFNQDPIGHLAKSLRFHKDKLAEYLTANNVKVEDLDGGWRSCNSLPPYISLKLKNGKCFGISQVAWWDLTADPKHDEAERARLGWAAKPSSTSAPTAAAKK